MFGAWKKVTAPCKAPLCSQKIRVKEDKDQEEEEKTNADATTESARCIAIRSQKEVYRGNEWGVKSDRERKKEEKEKMTMKRRIFWRYALG